MLHYYAKEFFSPVIVTSRITRANELLIYVVSDLFDELKNLSVEIIVYEWITAKLIDSKKLDSLVIVSFYFCYFIDTPLEFFQLRIHICRNQMNLNS